MKTGNTFYLQASRKVWAENDPCSKLSDNAKLLYYALKEMEQRFCTDDREFFWRSDVQLSEFMGWSLTKLKNAKAELKQHPELVSIKSATFDGSALKTTVYTLH